MILYLDTETKGRVDLRAAGTYRYADSADVLVITYAVDNMTVATVATGRALVWDDLPPGLQARIEDARTTIVCWNAGFDRAILTYALPGCPRIATERVKDAMGQAAASCMPPDLESASTLLGGPGKQDDGKKLIAKFCLPDSPWPIDTSDPDWKSFLAYAARDVVALRDAWLKTRPLTEAEWRVYWASEAVNERGVMVDQHFVQCASDLAKADVIRTNAKIRELTAGKLTSVYQHQAIAQWAHDRLPTEGQAILTVALKEEQDDEDDEPESTPVLSLDRRIVGRLLAYIEREAIDDPVLTEVLQLREFGASASPKKFHKILDQVVAGRLRGQYVYNGASTGRFTSKGAQVHNLNRTPLGGDYGDWEEPAIELVNTRCDLDSLHRLGDGEVPSRKLSLLLRPAFIAPIGRTLVKADYSQVEARGLPWLAHNRDANNMLDVFKRLDEHPDAPDLYTAVAAGMLQKEPPLVTKQERQIGKVTILACGYGGAVGALLSMAANYGMYLTREEALTYVGQWRDANPWAPAFWGRHNAHESYGLWGAAMRAYRQPGTGHQAGRIAYVFEPRLYNGTLVCILPSKRLLFYPFCRYREHEKRDKRTGEVISRRETLVYRRNGNYVGLWPGLLAENVTQAACADLLREAIVALEAAGESVVLHSHDEIVCETSSPGDTADRMGVAMLTHAWTDGFPLAVDITERWYYSAAKKRNGA